MPEELTIVPDFLRELIFKMRAVTLGDADTPQDTAENVLRGSHHLILQEETETGLPREELVEEIDNMDLDHQLELVALMWVGRGDFGAEEWSDALTLAAERADSPTSHYLLAHPMAADDIASGLEALGHDHILQDGSY